MFLFFRNTCTLLHFYTFTLLHFDTFAFLHFYTFTVLHFYTFAFLRLNLCSAISHIQHFCTFALLHFCTPALVHFCICTMSHPQRKDSAAGNWTRVFRVTGGSTNHCTTADPDEGIFDDCRRFKAHPPYTHVPAYKSKATRPHAKHPQKLIAPKIDNHTHTHLKGPHQVIYRPQACAPPSGEQSGNRTWKGGRKAAHKTRTWPLR